MTMEQVEFTPRALVEMFKRQLISYRETTPHPEELEWEIRLYDFILEDPETRFPQYQGARGKSLPLLDKREVAKSLGWEVP